ncbi:MBL fold metallo-hydrolase, partial [Wolbachia endosymbiont of Chironomus riparius]|uniref:MBL fold metallo-hydrolase n=1 Tax=Wolbachia endosymbiont of Chironomus riparius TaxID=2883238 RepID=UPI0020A0F049
MKKIITVGSGPVGSFMAVLCVQLGFQVTVYEKREDFTRNINVKIESNFFKEVQKVLSQLNVKSEFFAKLNEYLRNQKNRILIKELEEKFTKEAKSLGAKYVIREVNSFEELRKEHKDSNPIILDCTGKNSKLRMGEFGSDESNLVITPLQHAMYINFKAKITDRVPSLYQVMKYVKNVKLTEAVISKCKDANGFSNVTIPIFITEELALIFDREFPDINRNPLNPFNSSNPLSDSIFFPISSVLGNLIVDDCDINLNSVEVKKIEIGCGYAKHRSKDNCVCLGDSAIHLAFFRSLNVGLKHALELFIKLSMLKSNVETLKESEIIKEFKAHHPHLRPINVYPTNAQNVFLVVTKVINYECFSYCLTNHKRERLTPHSGVYKSQISDILKELNDNLRWSNLLANFEAKRDEDINSEIQSNKTKSILYDYLSWFIDINGKSPIKISETARAIKGKDVLHHKDFEFLLKCFKARREAISGGYFSINAVSNLLHLSESKGLEQLKTVCAKENLSDGEKIKAVSDIVSSKFAQNIDTNSQFILALIKNELAQMQGPSIELNSTSCNTSITRSSFISRKNVEKTSICCITALLSATLVAGLFATKSQVSYIVCSVIIVTAFTAIYTVYKMSKSSTKKEEAKQDEENLSLNNQNYGVKEGTINVNPNYIDELKTTENYSEINFKRVEKVQGMYVTDPNNENTDNDSRIFKETQAKRILRSLISLFVPKNIKSKLSYFSQGEDKDKSKIYKFDRAQDLHPEEKYAIQNIGHATQLIQIPGFNILTDPVFYDLMNLLYSAKTESHPKIEGLPKIDVILISHNHRDHVDKNSLQELLKHHQEKNWPQPRVFVPMEDKKLLESCGFSNVEEVEWYTKISCSKDVDGIEKKVDFISIPADHRSGRYHCDHHKSLISGWIINPEQEDVIFKFSGDTRSLSNENQEAVDAVIWNEIKNKKVNKGKKDENIEIPDIICLEPSGPNYTRCDMDITHQSTSYSALLKFIEAENLAKLTGKSSMEFSQKIQTVVMHHNKFELGPDRFNEGLFVLKKLLNYLSLNEEDLNREHERQN